MTPLRAWVALAVSYIILLLLAANLQGCASTTPFTVQFCPGHPKALTESDRSRHVCHLGDKLGLWKAEERRKIREGFH